MPAIAGRGGYVVLKPYGGTAATFNNSTWEVDDTAIKVACTPARAGTGIRYLTENTDAKWVVSAPLDTSELVQDLSIEEGRIMDKVLFAIGQATTASFQMFDKIAETLIEDVRIVKDETDAIRVQISGCGGVLTRGVTA